MLKEKNSRIGGIKITISKAIKEIVHAKNKYGFRGEFLLNKETSLELWFKEWKICDKHKTVKAIVNAIV